uniref:Uncharacterized protein n=1 Tax=Ciona intestinalis TaxID=7719 RepID=F7AD92_CIOIN
MQDTRCRDFCHVRSQFIQTFVDLEQLIAFSWKRTSASNLCLSSATSSTYLMGVMSEGGASFFK